MESLQKLLLLVPMMVLTSTAYVACSSDEGDFGYELDAGGDTKNDLNVPSEGKSITWPDAANIEDAFDADVDDTGVDDADAPFSGTG